MTSIDFFCKKIEKNEEEKSNLKSSGIVRIKLMCKMSIESLKMPPIIGR